MRPDPPFCVSHARVAPPVGAGQKSRYMFHVSLIQYRKKCLVVCKVNHLLTTSQCNDPQWHIVGLGLSLFFFKLDSGLVLSLL
jgi:hypothetical protein